MERKPRNYWTKERVFEKAKEYSTKHEFHKGCPSAYDVALKNGWLKEMYWFKERVAHNKKWTKERVFKKAMEYETRSEFAKGCPRAYTVARINGWLEEMKWFKEGKKPNGYWENKERVFEKAREYKTRKEFAKGCPSAYDVAWRNGWLDEMSWFVDGRVKLLADKNDSVYNYYWKETNAIYIGRTLIAQQNVRHHAHSTSEEDTVFRYAKENGLEVPQMEIIEENITPIEALEREDYWVKYYKKKGYNVLNKAKTGVGCGSLGAMNFRKWTKERVFEKAMEYQSRCEFRKGCMTAYRVALKNGWIEEMFWFKDGKKPNGYWTKERVFEEARKYKTRYEFAKGCKRAYKVAWKNGWLDELFCEDCRKKKNGKKSKAVFQIEPITNQVIAEFPSTREVERQLGFTNTHISKCCLGRNKYAYNFIWRYKESAA